MPRCARIKSNESIYHVMVRSVGDMNLYRGNEDKEKYLQLIKKYQIKFGFKVYAYCLMDNHGHILIDSNGADISKFMHGLNQSYAQYYNIKYDRHGHVFGDRFKSKIIKDDRYLINVSGYIHNNPKEIRKWKEKYSSYPYSSLSIYLGNSQDKYQLLDSVFILQLFDKLLHKAREKYLYSLDNHNDNDIKNDIEFRNVKSEYRSERIILARDYSPKEVIDFVSEYLNVDKRKIKLKYNREATKSKAFIIFLMSRFCNYNIKDICEEIGNITQSRVSMLCKIGINEILENNDYKNIVEDFLKLKIS